MYIYSIEGYNQQIRKATKTKGAFPNDMALLKLAYLATKNIEKKWNKPTSKLELDHPTIIHQIW